MKLYGMSLANWEDLHSPFQMQVNRVFYRQFERCQRREMDLAYRELLLELGDECPFFDLTDDVCSMMKSVSMMRDGG